MVYAPELFNTNLTDPFAPTANPNDFGDGTNRFVELYNLARKQEKEKAKDGSGDKALKKSVQSDHVVKMTPAGWASSLPDSESSKSSP